MAKHLLEHNHKITSIEQNLKIIKPCQKGNNMTAWEELAIFKAKTKNSDELINEQLNFESDIVYKNIKI